MIARSRLPALALLALGTSASVHGLSRALANRMPLRTVLGSVLWIEVTALAAAVALGALAMRSELLASRRGEARARPLAPVAALFVVLVAAWILFLALVQPFQSLWFDMVLGGAAGTWAGLFLLEGRIARLSPPIRRTLRIAGPVLVSLAATVVLLELSLRAFAELAPSPLLVRVGDAPRRLLERFRCTPGELRFGFPFNRGGHYDEELRRKRAGERLVASIGDSFSVSAVPHAWHFTTVCERELGSPVANFGAPGIGPPEYLRLLVDEAAPLDPDVIVIAVFVGNDLAFPEVEKGLPDGFLRSFLQRDSVLAWVLAQRLARIAQERERMGERSAAAAASPDESAFPWLSDPSLEEPTMSEEAFLRLETRRAKEACRAASASLGGLQEAMRAMKAAAGSAKLAVMLIPDEFQVEDELWAAVVANAGATLDRDRPQELVLSMLEQEEISCLDLLPVFRSVPPLEDGKRHLYHLRDTHWNARGNRSAGEALARFLASVLE